MEQRHIWCSCCNDISVCESLVRMESDVRYFQERFESEWDEWRSKRKDPASCLKCGNPVDYVPASNCEPLSHVGCGGTIQCSMTVASFNGPATYPHLYDVDGVFLTQGRRPISVHGQFLREYVPMQLFYVDAEANKHA